MSNGQCVHTDWALAVRDAGVPVSKLLNKSSNYAGKVFVRDVGLLCYLCQFQA